MAIGDESPDLQPQFLVILELDGEDYSPSQTVTAEEELRRNLDEMKRNSYIIDYEVIRQAKEEK